MFYYFCVNVTLVSFCFNDLHKGILLHIEVGLHTQPEEVTTGAIPVHHLPEHLMVGHQPHPPPEQQSSGEGLDDGPGSPTAAFSALEVLPEAPGLHQFRGTIHRVWAPYTSGRSF